MTASGSMDAPATSPDPTIHREVERRVRLPAGVPLPRLVGDGWTATAGERASLVADYYDTADQRLLRWGVTLRRRTGGADAGWHLKLPVAGEDGSVRDEVRVPLGAGAEGQVPDVLADIVRAFTRSAPLELVATIRTDRSPVTLHDDDGPLVEVVDDRVAARRGDEVLPAFRVVEVEVLGERDERTDGVVRAVVDALVGAGGTPQAGKLASVLAPDGVGAPDVVVPPAVGPHDRARDAVVRVLATHVRDLLLADVAARRGLPDAVHKLRVAARRLRSLLRAFGPVLDEQWARMLRDELGWATDGMGTARDTEVFRERLDEHAEQLTTEDREEAVRGIAAWVDARLAQATAVALETMRAERYLRLLDRLVEAARAPRFTAETDGEARAVLSVLARRPVRALVTEVTGLGPESTAAQWHRARICAKRARYADDAVVPMMGEGTRRRAEALERVTDVLGDLHDASVAQSTLRELAAEGRSDGPEGFALGQLAAIEAGREDAARADFWVLWREARGQIRWKG
jgi:CHAD domain-containing protein